MARSHPFGKSECRPAQLERAGRHGLPRRGDLREDRVDVHAAVRRAIAREAAVRLDELSLAAVPVAPLGVKPRDGDVHESLQEVALLGRCFAPLVLELLVRVEVLAGADQLEAPFETHAPIIGVRGRCYVQRVATILLVGVDLFFRGKLEGLLPGHRLVTSDSVDPPDLVIADIARVEPEEVVEAWPDIPVLGYTNHTDKSGLQRAHAAGFDQVIVKSALVERAAELVTALTGSEAAEPS